MFEETIAASQRLITEAFGEGNLDLIDELCAENFVGHDALVGDQDREASKQTIAGYRAAFPDLSFTIDDAFAADDKAVIRWTAEGTFENELLGLQPTGERGAADRGDHDRPLRGRADRRVVDAVGHAAVHARHRRRAGGGSQRPVTVQAGVIGFRRSLNSRLLDSASA